MQGDEEGPEGIFSFMEEAERLTKLIAAVVFQKAIDEVPKGEEYAIFQLLRFFIVI